MAIALSSCVAIVWQISRKIVDAQEYLTFLSFTSSLNFNQIVGCCDEHLSIHDSLPSTLSASSPSPMLMSLSASLTFPLMALTDAIWLSNKVYILRSRYHFLLAPDGGVYGNTRLWSCRLDIQEGPGQIIRTLNTTHNILHFAISLQVVCALPSINQSD